ncbi:MAG TPA: DUF4389 domain-containing protein [Rhizomicrobium sp.]|jgi:hypothetical protein|nr:DUF4389 domain-containing protein [Rhizomicrobium sp.]
MSDTPNSSGTVPPPGLAPSHPPFPIVRILYSLGYGVLAWLVLHILFFLAVVQVVMLAINGRLNEELKSFCLTLLQYEWELLAFIVFVRDEQPFPIGPFPKHA